MLKSLIIFLVFTGFAFAAKVGETFPDFTLNKLGGGTFTLSEHRGKVVYIYWFGNGCPSCININGPKTQTEIVDKYSTGDFVPIGIDTWNGGTESVISSFKSQAQINYDLCLNGIGLATQNQVDFDLSMVIDQQGVVRYIDSSPLYTQHNWSEINMVIDGLLTTAAIEDAQEKKPNAFELKNNYPNPFNPTTQIPFSVDKTQNITLQIFNAAGKLIKTLFDAQFAAGSYQAVWDGQDKNGNPSSSGIYFYRLSGEKSSVVKRMILLK